MSKHKKTRDIHKPDLIGEVDKDIAWLIIISIGLIPILVRFQMIDFTAPRIVGNILNTGLQADCFTYYKWICLLVAALAAIILLLLKMLFYHYELRASYVNIPILLLSFFVILSLINAEYKSISLVGLYNQREGALSYLAYFALFFVAANTKLKEWFAKYIITALGIFITINLLLIMFDFFGIDLSRYPIIMSLVVPANLQQYIQGTLNSTLGNPNYVSGIAAALFAFFLTFGLLEKCLKRCLVYILLAVASFALILASLSSSGFISLLIVSPIIVIITFLGWNRKQTLIAAGLTLTLCFVVFILLNAYNPQISSEMLDFTKQISNNDTSAVAASPEEAQGSQLKTTPVKTSVEVKNTVEESFDLPALSSSSFSRRSYIWKETVKLIGERPLLGYGQDTMAYYFPQNDINKISGLNSYNSLTSKPHNMYLGIAFGSGIPALLTLLALFLLHFYYTGKHLLKLKRDELLIFPAALFLSFCVFLVQWLVNDPVIGSSVIFWTLLGVGVSLNYEKT